MLVGMQIRLIPNKNQVKQFIQFCGTARFIYNTCLSYKVLTYTTQNKILSEQDCRKYIQELKKTEQYAWINETPEAISKMAIHDLFTAYKRFYNGISNFPKFKKKNQSTQSFYQRIDRFKQVDISHVKITGIKTLVKCSKYIIPQKIYDTRIIFDGKYWYLCYKYDKQIQNINNSQEIIGVDLGIKNLAICSNGKIYPNINNKSKIKKLEHHKKHLQKCMFRKYKQNNNQYNKTKNILKIEQRIRLLDRKIHNIRHTYIHTVTSNLVKTKPKAIIIEDLNIKQMIKNKYLSKAILDQAFYKCRKQLEYKGQLYNIQIIIANRFFPSSKRCFQCGYIKKDLQLNERIYLCPICNTKIDRDYNASLNLKQYYFIKNI